MSRGRIRRRAAALVLALVCLAAAAATVRALGESRKVWKRSHRLRNETLTAAQDRSFGREYMQAIRAIRERVPENATVYLLDRQSREQGACYFALHYLAPRRLVLVRQAPAPPHNHRRRGRDGAPWVVAVGDPGTPLALLQGAPPGRGRSRAR